MAPSNVLQPSSDQMSLEGFTKVTDGATYQMLVKTRPVQYAGVREVLFYIPGNPGVATAYVPWLNEMSQRMGPGCLVVFSSHLGHFEGVPEVQDFTCDDNVIHQAKMITEIYTKLKAQSPEIIDTIKFYLGGHSTGAPFIVEAVQLVMESIPQFRDQVTMIFYCGTVVEFAFSGRLRARIAATPAGADYMVSMKESERVQKFAKNSLWAKRMLDELTDKVIGNMSTLLRDELEWLPRNKTEQIQAIKNLSLPTFFLFAANDPYIPKSFQAQIYKVFGPDHVFIGQYWWHAYCLQSAAFLESASLTEFIMKEGRISTVDDKTMVGFPSLWSGMMSDLQTAVGSIAMALWFLPQVLRASCKCTKTVQPGFKIAKSFEAV